MYTRNKSHNQVGAREISGTVKIAADGKVDSTTMPGVSGVTQDSTGVYTFTFVDSYTSLLGYQIGIEAASLVEVRHQITDGDVSGNGAIEVTFWSYASPPAKANPASATLYVSFDLDTLASV